jgi:hypothetical protein
MPLVSHDVDYEIVYALAAPLERSGGRRSSLRSRPNSRRFPRSGRASSTKPPAGCNGNFSTRPPTRP